MEWVRLGGSYGIGSEVGCSEEARDGGRLKGWTTVLSNIEYSVSWGLLLTLCSDEDIWVEEELEKVGVASGSVEYFENVWNLISLGIEEHHKLVNISILKISE